MMPKRWSVPVRAGIGFAILCLAAYSQPGRAASADPISPHDIQIARDAFKLADHGNWPKAEALAGEASDKLPLKILQWLDLQRPVAGHSFAEIAAFIEANPDWPHQVTLRSRAEETLPAVPEATLKLWFEHHKPVSPFARLRAAEIIAASGRNDEATDLIRQSWIHDDFGAADEKLVLAKFGDRFRPEDHIARLERLLWDGRPGDAERMLAHVPAERRLVAEARIKLAASARGAEAAVAAVPASLQNDPGLLFDRMRWYRRKDQDERALEIMDRARELGRPELWWPERQVLARHLLQQNEPARAYQVVAQHHLTEPGALVDAEFTAGWIALRFLKEPAKAAPHFARLFDVGKLPLTISRGAYWSGRAAEAQGQSAVALDWYAKAAQYPTTYYGQLAAAVPGVAPPPKPVPEPRASAAEMAAFNRRELVHAARIMAAIGEDDQVRPFLNRLSESATSPAEHALIADLAEDLGRPDLGVAASKKAMYAGVTLLRAGYPLVPMPRNAGAEQALLLALTRQESEFNIKITSKAGARGLMQLMPGSAAEAAKMVALPYSEHRLTTDGVYNVTLGQAFIDSMLSSFSGSYLLAIASYNAGPGNVQKWVNQFGDPRSPEVDAVDWVELIPFAETRNYVQRVLENLQVYRLRIGNKSLAFSLDSDLRR